MTLEKATGRVITFYSYKGGTGRSMALANMAWLLAMAGRKVLAIDWDLEAPGLHRYFHPFLSDPDLTSSDGVIDFVNRFVEEASSKDLSAELPADWYVPYANIVHYANTLDYAFPSGGLLDFIPAGRQGDTYADRVNSFNWKQFYEKLGGWSVLEDMRRQLVAEYEFVLIDSRTGVSDTSGICTVQLPDQVAICFTLNYQSVDGASAAAGSIVEQRGRLKKPIRLFPVPMRVETTAETLKRTEVSRYAQSRFLALIDERDVPKGTPREKYWGEVEIPYIGFYAFEELLAWFLDPPHDTKGVLKAVKQLARYMTGLTEIVDLPGPDPTERDEILAEYGAVWGRPQASPVREAPRTAVYLSANVLDRDETQRLAGAVDGVVGDVMTNAQLSKDQPWREAFREGLQRSKAMLLLVGQHGVSHSQQRELVHAFEHRGRQEKAAARFPIVPVLLHGGSPNRVPVTADPLVELTAESSASSRVRDVIDGAARAGRGPTCPYPGPRAFRTEEAELFRGRELYVERLLNEVRQSTYVEVGGASGSGRTSAVRAGLIARLLAQDAPLWKAATFTFDGDPFESMAESLVWARDAALSAEQVANEVATLLAAFRRGSAPACRDAMTSILSAWPPADRLLLVADDVPSPDHPTVRLLRSWLDQVPATLLIVHEAHTTIPALGHEELKNAIELPARRAGIDVEPELIEALIADTQGQHQLPLLQFCFRSLWEKRTDHRLTTAAYERFGGATKVVDAWAEERFASLSTTTPDGAIRLLTRFVVVPDSGAMRPRTVAPTLFDPAWLDDLSELVKVGLVVKRASAAERYRLAHPLLLEQWSRLANALERDRSFLRLRHVAESFATVPASARVVDAPAALASNTGSLVLHWRLALVEGYTQLSERRNDLTATERAGVEQAKMAEEASRAAQAREDSARTRTRGLVVGGTATLAAVVAMGIGWWSVGPSQIVSALQKISGDGQIVRAMTDSLFQVRAVNAAGQPARGAKIVWETPICQGQVFVTQTDERGIAEAGSPCQIPASGASTALEITATVAEPGTLTGFRNASQVAKVGSSVVFKLQIDPSKP